MTDEIKPSLKDGKLFEVPEPPKPPRKMRRDRGYRQRGVMRALLCAWCAFWNEMGKPPRKRERKVDVTL